MPFTDMETNGLPCAIVRMARDDIFNCDECTSNGLAVMCRFLRTMPFLQATQTPIERIVSTI